MKKMEVKLAETCNDIMIMVDENLIPSSITKKSFVFYYKMKDNYYMYLVEFKNDNERKKIVSQSLKTYETITTIAYWTMPNQCKNNNGVDKSTYKCYHCNQMRHT